MLPPPPPDSVFYDDQWLYACLAFEPLTKGHVIVAWKHLAPDIKVLTDDEYDYLMEVVDVARDALLAVLGVEKVYLIYMDETQQVHWHLVPRYNEQGANVLLREPKRTTDFSFAPLLRAAFLERSHTRKIRLPGASE
jgi:diadenosine tetraphosphate (Ap4A) HIT family hydrolase